MTTIKENPFERSNPFPIHHSVTSFRHYQPVSINYRPIISNQNKSYEPMQQNKYSIQHKYQQQTWKFRQDNCNKHRSFAQKPKILFDNQKSGFQKQLNVSRIRNRNQQKEEFKNQKIQNPFYRKNLVVGKMAESYVYIPDSSYQIKNQSIKSPIQVTSVQNYQIANSRYSKYPPNEHITSAYNLNSQKHLDDYNSPQQNSLKYIQGLYSRKSFGNEENQRQYQRRYSRQRESKQEIVKFDQNSRQNSKYSSKSRQKSFQRQIDNESAPQKIIVKNKTFYRNPVELY